MTTTFLGKGGISATVIKDSITANSVRLTTLEIEYPRFILSELNTHRMLSKNSQSSRAVPVNRMLELLQDHYAQPVWWGKQQPGMVAREEVDEITQTEAWRLWREARDDAMWNSEKLLELGLHKQIVNRVTEPFQMMKTVVSATEWENFFWLRDHPDAQPEFQELAQQIHRAMNCSLPRLVLVGEWHLPYVSTTREDYQMVYRVDGETVDLETAKWVSASACAQVSYRRLDTSLEKAQDIFQRLIQSDPPHMSPCEHLATPMPTSTGEWAPGITHQDRMGNLWSANYRGWIQYRKTLSNEAKW